MESLQELPPLTTLKLGSGFLESNYKTALEVLLREAELRVEREVSVHVVFRGHPLGNYRMDMVVEGKVVVEVKATRGLAEGDERQLINYLRATPYEVGLLLNFGPKPSVRRLVFTADRKANGTAPTKLRPEHGH